MAKGYREERPQDSAKVAVHPGVSDLASEPGQRGTEPRVAVDQVKEGAERGGGDVCVGKQPVEQRKVLSHLGGAGGAVVVATPGVAEDFV